MSAIKCKAEEDIYRLADEGYTIEEIANILDCHIEFVEAYLGGIDD